MLGTEGDMHIDYDMHDFCERCGLLTCSSHRDRRCTICCENGYGSETGPGIITHELLCKPCSIALGIRSERCRIPSPYCRVAFRMCPEHAEEALRCASCSGLICSFAWDARALLAHLHVLGVVRPLPRVQRSTVPAVRRVLRGGGALR